MCNVLVADFCRNNTILFIFNHMVGIDIVDIYWGYHAPSIHKNGHFMP